MLRLTKIFHFEMAHAIHGYQGPCKNIHGHSYELHVCFQSNTAVSGAIPPPGFLMDFKDLKKMVKGPVVDKLDHSLVTSEAYLAAHPGIQYDENLQVWQMEPSAENILYHIQKIIEPLLPQDLKLVYMKIYETKDSFAEWFAD